MHEQGEVVLVTGASSGIGAALATEWARRGARLVLAARRRERLESVAAEVRRLGGEAAVVECDVTRDGDPEQAVARGVAEWGRLDVAVANAGFGLSGTFDELTLDDYRRQMETNVFGLLRTLTAVLPEIRRSRGRIALVGSVAGFVSTPGASAYGMSKAAVGALAQSLRHELRPEGVSVTHIAPGFVESEFRLKDARERLRPDARESVPAWLLVPSEVAARAIVRAVMRRRREAIITGHGRVLVFLARHTPWLVDLMLSRTPAWRRRDLAQRAGSGREPTSRA
jgi:short-subunit dehydrogenase